MNKERAKNIDKKMFDCIKILLNGGASYREIQEYTNVGKTTIGRIASSENWEEYRQQLAAMSAAFHAKYAAKRAEKKAEEEAAAAKAMEEKEKAAKAVTDAVKAVPAASLVQQRQANPIDQVYGANRICELLTHQNELLKGIMNKLAFIVDELTGIPSPKGGDQ